ncbi:hypothetical protein LTR95_016829 [Oleoguttula sp. CCFEE 5521]
MSQVHRISSTPLDYVEVLLAAYKTYRTVRRYYRGKETMPAVSEMLFSQWREDLSTPPGPPSYATDDQNKLLDRLGSVMVKGWSVSANADAAAEDERLRNFILFCICIDYRCRHDLALSAADKHHFIEMSQALDILPSSNTKMSYLDREEMAPYFWMFLHEPCATLNVSVECAAYAISRFAKHQNILGLYKGSNHGILHSRGLEALAQKLWVDRNVVLPRISTFARLCFERIDGVTEMLVEARSYAHLSSIDYTPSERGKAYDRDRRTTLSIVERGRAMSSIVREQARIRLGSLRDRPDVFPASGLNRQQQLFRAHWDDRKYTLEVEATTSSDRVYPWKWWPTRGFHLPDLFERRPLQYQCDV